MGFNGMVVIDVGLAQSLHQIGSSYWLCLNIIPPQDLPKGARSDRRVSHELVC